MKTRGTTTARRCDNIFLIRRTLLRSASRFDCLRRIEIVTMRTGSQKYNTIRTKRPVDKISNKRTRVLHGEYIFLRNSNIWMSNGFLEIKAHIGLTFSLNTFFLSIYNYNYISNTIIREFGTSNSISASISERVTFFMNFSLEVFNKNINTEIGYQNENLNLFVTPSLI